MKPLNFRGDYPCSSQEAWTKALLHRRSDTLEERGSLSYSPSAGQDTDAFSGDVDYAMLIKHYGNSTGTKCHERKYSPAEYTGATKEAIFGNPIIEDIGTSHIERQNLTMRMGMRRFTRLTNAFSRKAENHAYAVTLHFMHYNFVRTHKTLRMTPAMAADLVDTPWEVEDIVALVEKAEDAAPKKRGPYRKSQKKDISK